MTNEDLANLLFPNITKTIEDYEKEYPKRNLKEGAEVLRFAPSPTGRMHMGNLYASFIPEVFSHQTDGTFILRIEDTDSKREIDDGVNLIIEDLKAYNYQIDEGPITGGGYGPYIQSERKNIYACFAKYLVSIGRAYPCFCFEEDLEEIRNIQTDKKERVGYYGDYARCRNLSYEEVKKNIEDGKKFTIRLRSIGNFDKKIIFKDRVKGTMSLPENDIDHVLVKSDGIPPYAFAHVVDDHLMRVTTVTRDDSYISSVPYHLEIWNAFNFEIPKFAHILPLNKKDGDTVRKLSKRKDPEAAVSFYNERGIPSEAVKLYFATLLNSNFEMWYLQNPKSSYKDFTFTFDKMPKSGSIFDIDKLLNISKNYISLLSADTVFEELSNWAKEYDIDFYNLINNNKEYMTNILNIERVQKKPRKDFTCYKDVKNETWYMFDELFAYAWDELDKDINMVSDYFNNYYCESDSKEEWFNKIAEFGIKYNYVSMKEYKENPDAYKGHIGDICETIRYIVTTRHMTPDLYEILKLLGKERILNRINKYKESN